MHRFLALSRWVSGEECQVLNKSISATRTCRRQKVKDHNTGREEVKLEGSRAASVPANSERKQSRTATHEAKRTRGQLCFPAKVF